MLTFGDLVREKRNSKQLSVRELARRVNLDAGYISKLENNQAKHPSFPVVVKIGEELGILWNELSSVFGLDEDLVGGFDKYTDTKVVGDERQIWRAIVQNIDKMTDETEINLDIFSSLLKDIHTLHDRKNSGSKMFSVISKHEDNLIRILKTPYLDDRLLYLYEALMGISETESFIVKGDVLKTPECRLDPEVMTLRELWLKCKSVEPKDDKFGYFAELAKYLDKLNIL